METLKALTERRSIRQYQEKPVTAEQIQEIIDIARFSPTWKNSQTVRYYAILDKELKDKIAEVGTLGFSKNGNNIRSASALIVLATIDGIAGYEKDGTPTTAKGSHWQSFDAGIACQSVCLTAYDKGLGTLIMGIYDEKKIAELISLPEGQSISALIAVGYADEAPTAPKRKTLDEILTIL
ncbi:MAG TPA: nitroreductase [Ruminococcus sp.]|nr:nitroreductase [Ruminococcus sp.]